MRLDQNRLRDAFFSVALASVLAISASANAQQDRRHGSSRGSSGRSSFAGRMSSSRSTHMRSSSVSKYTRSGNYGRSGYTPGRTVGSYLGQGRGGVNRSETSGFQGRPERFAPQAGVRMDAGHWRQSHPDWNGQYYFHNGAYFFDPLFAYPAIVANTWDDVAIGAGGLAMAGALVDDPTLYFSGTYGALFPIADVQIDIGAGDPDLRLRAAFFNRPYFWRDGVRYDRETVSQNGRQYYRFRRH